jgi:hypothetical protein
LVSWPPWSLRDSHTTWTTFWGAGQDRYINPPTGDDISRHELYEDACNFLWFMEREYRVDWRSPEERAADAANEQKLRRANLERRREYLLQRLRQEGKLGYHRTEELRSIEATLATEARQ